MEMGTHVTNHDLKEIMEEITRMFHAKLEENSFDKTVSVSEPSQMMKKIELLPNDIKLEGMRNYLSWSRRALLNLWVRELEKYVTGKYTESGNKEGAEWRMWSNTNSLVVSWLLTSVSPNIARMVESISSVAQV
jgi:hypothetical protein